MRAARSSSAFAARLGAPHASAVSSGTAGLHLALRAVGVGEGDEVVTSPFSFVASANAIVYERREAGVRRHRPATLNLDPEAARAAVTDRTTALLPVHIFGYPADLPAFEALRPADRRGRLRGARRASTPTARRSARAGTRRCSRFYANKQMTTGEGGMVTLATRRSKERIDSERNQGRAPDMGWLDHDRLGFNYRLSRPRSARSASPSSSASTTCSPPARASPAGTARRSPASRASTCRARTPAATAAAGSSSSSSCRAGVDRDATIVALRERGVAVQAVPAGDPPHELLPRALRPPRGRVPGLRGRRRPLARAAVLPADDEGQVEQVAEALRGARNRQDRCVAGVRRLALAARSALPLVLLSGVCSTRRRVSPSLERPAMCRLDAVGAPRRGLLFLLPVASPGWTREPLVPARARAYAGWGVTLYLLGFLLAWQVARIQDAGAQLGSAAA